MMKRSRHSELPNYILDRHKKFHEKANSLQELLNLQSLHANVHIMPAYFTLLQEEIDKLLGNAKEEIAIIYLCFPV